MLPDLIADFRALGLTDADLSPLLNSAQGYIDVWRKVQAQVYVPTWSSWESLGGVLYSCPAACSWGSGRLDVFVKAAAGDINHKWYQNGWSNWESLGNPPNGQVTSDPAAVSWGSGRIDFFVRANDNALGHKWFG